MYWHSQSTCIVQFSSRWFISCINNAAFNLTWYKYHLYFVAFFHIRGNWLRKSSYVFWYTSHLLYLETAYSFQGWPGDVRTFRQRIVRQTSHLYCSSVAWILAPQSQCDLCTVWGVRLWKGFCKMFSESSRSCWIAAAAMLPGNVLQSIVHDLMPHTVFSSFCSVPKVKQISKVLDGRRFEGLRVTECFRYLFRISTIANGEWSYIFSAFLLHSRRC